MNNICGRRTTIKCPYRLDTEYFVKEEWRARGGKEYEYQKDRQSVVYYESASTGDQIGGEWRSPLVMKEWASRFILKVRDIMAIRLYKFNELNAKAHGYQSVQDFREAWDSKYKGKGAEFGNDPYVWTIVFTKRTIEK